MTVVFVGDLNLDLRIRPTRSPVPGSDIPGAISLHPGGSAANAAVWAQRVGAGKTARFVGPVGDDETGRLLEGSVVGEGVEALLIHRPGRRSRAIAALIGADGNRAMISDRDGELSLTSADFDDSWLDGASWLHVNGHLLMNPRSRGLFHLLVASARRQALPFSFDPASSELLRDCFRPSDVLAAIDGASVVFPSRDEAEYLTGESDPHAAAKALNAVADIAAVTCDSEGSVISESRVSTSLPPHRVSVADAIGAGDAYAGGFLAAYTRGASSAEAGEVATRTAATCVQRPGAR